MRGREILERQAAAIGLVLIAGALLLRALIPAGWMPSADAGRWVELCTAQGQITAFVDNQGTIHREGAPGDDRAAEHCAFAGIGAPALIPPMAGALAHASVPAPLPLTGSIRDAIPGRGLAAPPPPATGPPATA